MRNTYRAALGVIAVMLAATLAVGAQPATAPTSMPSPTAVTSPKPATVDLISTALSIARGFGLDHDPDGIYVMEGTYAELRNPNGGIAPWYVSVTQPVWLVWIKAKFVMQALGMSNPVNNLLIYFSKDTGQAIDMFGAPTTMWGHSRPGGATDFSKLAWTEVSTADVGKYMIPYWDASMAPIATNPKQLPSDSVAP